MSSRERSTASGLTRFLLVALVALVGFAVAIPMIPGVVGDKIREAISGLIDEETIDRSGPSVLVSLTAISEFHAATGYYETVVDIEQDSILPSFIKGERVLYVGKGNVDAIVDFSELDERRVVLSEDGKSVAITLPAPRVDTPVLDLESSYVADSDGGLVDSLSGSDLERDAQLKAVDQMTAAAGSGEMLTDLAKENTSAMLRGLLGALGYTDITVEFEEDPL